MNLFRFDKNKNNLIHKDDFWHYQVLKSMSEIYYSMHLIDLVEDTVFEYKTQNEVKSIVNKLNNATIQMQSVIRKTVSPDHLTRMLRFTDLTALEDKLCGKKMISTDFIGISEGWVRATFITITADANEMPKTVMFTTQIVEEEKHKEERLLLKTNTDEMTHCYNRRAYEETLTQYATIDVEPNFAYISVDVNELKMINDTEGHLAGDESIIGTAVCLKKCFGNIGRVFRIGGDEFACIVYTNEEQLKKVINMFEESVFRYKSKAVKELSVSYGYVTSSELPKASFAELSKIAEERMYKKKNEYYSNRGIDRRGQYAAHAALCKLYSKILSVNLTDDSYQIINLSEEENNATNVFSPKLSEWLVQFGKSGAVHEDDVDDYLKQTDIEYLRDYFKDNKTSISIFYRRKIDGVFKRVMMEIIQANDYSDDNQHMFLYVKSIDK